MRELDINLVVEPSDAMRTDINETTVFELAQSIREQGLIEPIVVKPVGDHYEVVAGHRRLLACRSIGLPVIPCVIRTGDDKELELVKVHENLQREDVNVMDEARFYATVIVKHNMEVPALASMLRRSAHYVQSRLELVDYPKELQQALYDRTLTLGVAQKLAAIDDDVVRNMYLSYALNGGVSVATANAWLQAYKAGQRPQGTEQIAAIVPETPDTDRRTIIQCKFSKIEDDITEFDLVYIHKSVISILQYAYEAGNQPLPPSTT